MKNEIEIQIKLIFGNSIKLHTYIRYKIKMFVTYFFLWGKNMYLPPSNKGESQIFEHLLKFKKYILIPF